MGLPPVIGELTQTIRTIRRRCINNVLTRETKTGEFLAYLTRHKPSAQQHRPNCGQLKSLLFFFSRNNNNNNDPALGVEIKNSLIITRCGMCLEKKKTEIKIETSNQHFHNITILLLYRCKYTVVGYMYIVYRYML
jgi:hypothetical protein